MTWVNGRRVTLLPHDFDRLANEQVGQDVVGLPIPQRNIKLDHGTVAFDPKVGDCRSGTIDGDLGDRGRLRHLTTGSPAGDLNPKLGLQSFTSLLQINTGADENGCGQDDGNSYRHG